MERRGPPPPLRCFITAMYLVAAVGIVAVACSWIFFTDYADFFIGSHPDSFDGIEGTRTTRIIIAVTLGFRTLTALAVVASARMLDRLVRRPGARLSALVLAVCILGAAGYGYLGTRPALAWLSALRYLQATLFLCPLILILLPSSWRQITDDTRTAPGKDPVP
jgi:hypothetical protein